jgi:hypothetical protein
MYPISFLFMMIGGIYYITIEDEKANDKVEVFI